MGGRYLTTLVSSKSVFSKGSFVLNSDIHGALCLIARSAEAWLEAQEQDKEKHRERTGRGGDKEKGRQHNRQNQKETERHRVAFPFMGFLSAFLFFSFLLFAFIEKEKETVVRELVTGLELFSISLAGYLH